MNYFGKTIVRIDSYAGKVPSGFIYHSDYKKRIGFKGIMEFLLILEQIMEQMQSTNEEIGYRSFGRESEEEPPFNYAESVLAESTPKEKATTFILQILFRRNFSWQGKILWLEGEKEENFRSGLELLWIMNSALTCAEELEGST